MSAQTQIPSDIAAIIEQKRLAMKAKHEAEQREELEKRAATLTAGRAKLQEAIVEKLTCVPKWLHRYDVTASTFDDNDLERLAQFDQIRLWLHFQIPGLARIQMRSETMNGEDQPVNEWRSAQHHDVYREYGPNKPVIGFTNSSYWRTDLDFVLVEANEELDAYEQEFEEYNRILEERRARNEQQEALEQEGEARRTAERIEENREEQALFNLFKNDPVAINFLKAFMLINHERSGFTSQIEDANNSLYSMEEHWSRRAEELRRQADDAQRRAEDERSRLQSDLDNVEAKLVKEQRKNNGW